MHENPKEDQKLIHGKGTSLSCFKTSKCFEHNRRQRVYADLEGKSKISTPPCLRYIYSFTKYHVPGSVLRIPYYFINPYTYH